MSLFKFIFNHRSWRISKASKFGKIEHTAGRLLGLIIFCGLLFQTAMMAYLPIRLQDYIIFTFLLISIITWIIYLLAHTIEKKLYGHFGPRG